MALSITFPSLSGSFVFPYYMPPISRPEYTEPITVHVTKDQKKAIVAESWDRDLTVSQIVRRAIRKSIPSLNGNGKGHDADKR